MNKTLKWINIELSILVNDVEIFTHHAFENGAISIWENLESSEKLFSQNFNEAYSTFTVTVNSLIKPQEFISKIKKDTEIELIDHGNISFIDDKDWLKHTQGFHQSIKINNKLWICPTWGKIIDKKAINIIIDPGLAFGTGNHPTTQLCLRWIIRNAKFKTSLLDYGCGTGILGITAYQIGIKYVTGVDIDENALEIAYENSINNNSKLMIDFPYNLGNKKFDIVIANILKNPLINIKYKLINYLKKNGNLVLSGIQKSEIQNVKEEYHKLIVLETIATQDEWVLLRGELT